MYYKSLLDKEFKIVSSNITISGILVIDSSRPWPCIKNVEINLIRRDGSAAKYHRAIWYLSWGSSFENFSPNCTEIPKEDFFTLFSDGVPVYTNHDIFECVRK